MNHLCSQQTDRNQLQKIDQLIFLVAGKSEAFIAGLGYTGEQKDVAWCRSMLAKPAD